MLEILGTLIGILYLWLEYKASIHLWAVGIIMPIIYIFIFLESALYTQVAINAYYLIMSAYGWYNWKHPRKQATNERSICRFPRRNLPLLVITIMVIFALFVHILQRYAPSSTTHIEALSTTLSIIATWMLAKKYIEQWWAWIIADVVCVALYVQSELFYTAALYLLYTVIAVFGYCKWKQLMSSTPNLMP